MSWGTELWDRYEPLCKFVDSSIDFVDSSVAHFIKERGAIEGDYAKKLRNLVEKYKKQLPEGPKLAKEQRKNQGTLKRSDKHHADSGPASLGSIRPPVDDQFSYILTFQTMLEEVGFIAGQHEILSESFSKENYKNVRDQAKRLRECRKVNTKEFIRYQNELKVAFKAMANAKDKFKRSYEEQDKAATSYKGAAVDGTFSPNEVKKLNVQHQTKTSECDVMKAQYAGQMLKANNAQTRHYSEFLPSVLNELQKLEETSINLLCQSINEMVSKDQEVTPIIVRCHEAIAKSVSQIDPTNDTNLVIEKYKTGDVPPSEFKMDDIRDMDSLATKDALAGSKSTKFNLYPRKRELEKQMDAVRDELTKAKREAESLEKMIMVCRSQPKYGQSEKFQTEFTAAQGKARELETCLGNLQAEHRDVETKLESLKNRTIHVAPSTSEASSPLINSIQRNIDVRSSHCHRSNVSLSSSGDSNHSNGGTSPRTEAVNTRSSSHAENPYMNATIYQDYDGFDDEMPPPPPTSQLQAEPQPFSSTSSDSSSTSGSAGCKRVEAIYDFTDVQENNIPMTVGEQFYIVEDDCDGWTRVRRLMPTEHGHDDGYVPSSYLRIL